MRMLLLSLFGSLFFLIQVTGQAPHSSAPEATRDDKQHEQGNKHKGVPKKEVAPVPALDDDGKELNRAREAQETGGKKRYAFETVFAPETIASWGLVLVGIVAGYFAYRTLRAIKNQVEIARLGVEAARIAADAATVAAESAKRSADMAAEALHLTERADMLFENVGIRNDTIGSLRSAVFTMEFKNFGRTRATQLYAKFTVGAPDQESMTATAFGPTVTGSGDTLTVAFIPIGEYATEDTFKRLSAGEISLSLEGNITYEDVFGVAHRTVCVASFSGATRLPRFEILRKEAT